MSATLVKDLRERTGAGIKDCVSALAANNNDVDKAIDWLRTKGITNAAKKSGRAAAEGLVEAYIHAGGKIGVILEVNCETDFVALNQNFKDLVKGIAMHIACRARSASICLRFGIQPTATRMSVPIPVCHSATTSATATTAPSAHWISVAQNGTMSFTPATAVEICATSCRITAVSPLMTTAAATISG